MRAAVEARLGGKVTSATSSPGGFSPGLAARLRTSDGRRVFAKAAGPDPNPDTPAVHRREAEVVAALPAEVPAPKLLWTHEGDGWVVLAFEDVDGHNPVEPWRPDELDRVLETLLALAETLTPSPLPGDSVEGVCGWSVFGGHWERMRRERQVGLDGWSLRNLDRLAELETEAPDAAAGDTLLHLDLRADNVILTPDRVVVVDWPHVHVGAPWVDLLFFAPSVVMQGGPTRTPSRPSSRP